MKDRLKISHNIARENVFKCSIPVYNKQMYVIKYVENQANHHRKMSFEDEFIGLLDEYGIEYDIKYLFV